MRAFVSGSAGGRPADEEDEGLNTRTDEPATSDIAIGRRIDDKKRKICRPGSGTRSSGRETEGACGRKTLARPRAQPTSTSMLVAV